MLIAIIAGISVLGAVGIFFFFRWFFSEKRIALRRARRACRKGDVVACKEYEKLKGEL